MPIPPSCPLRGSKRDRKTRGRVVVARLAEEVEAAHRESAPLAGAAPRRVAEPPGGRREAVGPPAAALQAAVGRRAVAAARVAVPPGVAARPPVAL